MMFNWLLKLFSKQEKPKLSQHDQNRLAALNTLPKEKLGTGKIARAIRRQATRDMDKAIIRFKKQNLPINEKTLLKEVRETPGFLSMSEKAGVPYEWYKQMAKERMKAFGVE